MKQWKRLAALSSAIVMAAATLTYFPNDTLQNIRLELSASAETTTEPQVWKEDNLTWTLDADGMLNISGTGAMKDYDYYYNNSSPVCENSNVKKVVIEDGVTSIGNWAFCNCTSLTDITIPDSVTSIGNSAFTACWKLISITIPDSVTSIGDFAFYACGLTSITIPNGVTSIGTYAFSYCSSLTSITIPDGVTSIGYGAFSDCNSLKTISLSCGSTLKRSDFSDQANLVSYTSHILTKTAAKAVTCTENGNKEYWTCEHCKKYFLSDDANPETAKAVEQSEFIIPASHKLTKVEAKAPTCTEDGNKEYWTCEHCGKYFLSDDTNPETATAVEQSEFIIPASHKLTKVEAKDATCTESGNKEYWTCEHCGKYFLSDDTNPETAKAVELSETVISASHKLTKVKEEKAPTCTEDGNKEYWTCEHCGKYFLSDDTNPKTAKAVELSETVIPALKHKNATTRGAVKPTETDPGYSGDRYCPDCDTVLEKGYTYWNEDNLTWKLDADGTLTISGTGAMKNYNNTDNLSPVYKNSSVKKVVIEDGVTNIGERAFYDCSSLTSITIPDSVTSIGTSAFNGCISLPSITLPDSVTSIGNFAFEWCSGLSSITLSNNITSIGDFAFHGCPLTSITIPDSVTSIGEMAFHSCSNLKSITIPDSVTSIESAVFYNCTSLTSITIPDSVTSIGYAVFEKCTNLQTISLSCKSSLKKSDFGGQANLVSVSHTLKKTAAKAATCTEDGNKEYWTCEHCGKYFLSDDANPETAKAVELSETVIPALVQVATATTPIKCVYGQDMNKIDLRDYVKNTDVVGEVSVKVATGSALPDGMKLDGSKLSGKPAKAYEDGREVTFTFTAENGSTENLTLLFLVEKADPTVEVAVSGDSHTEGDLVKDLELILSENSTKGVVQLVSEIKTLIAGKNTLTWKFMPEDENNYHAVTGTVVVNAQTTTTTTTTKATTTKATTTTKPSKTTTTKATTTTKPSKTTTTKVTTTTKPSKTTTTKATTTTKPSKTTTTKATTTTKPSKTTTTKVTTTTKPSKTTTTKVTTTTKPSKTTTTKATTTTKPSKTTTTNATTTTKPSKTTTTKATTTTKPSKTTTTNATTATKPSKTTTTNAMTTTKPSKTTTTKVTTTTKPSKTTTTNATTTTKPNKTTTTKVTTTTITTTTTTATRFYGDVNLDGKVDILDAVFLNKYLATLIQFSDAQMANADCCQDGVLNDQDTTALMQFIILLIDDLPVQPTEK